MQKITSSLILATYNWKEALELVLMSVMRQSVKPFEVIIADDGSREDTKALIDEYRKKFDIPLIHVWHEDKGFRLSEIRNKAIKQARGNYIIQIDGDTILHKDFVKTTKNMPGEDNLFPVPEFYYVKLFLKKFWKPNNSTSHFFQNR